LTPQLFSTEATELSLAAPLEQLASATQDTKQAGEC